MKDWLPRVIIGVLFIATLALPLLWGGGGREAVSDDALRLVVVTPHNEQIRHEFARAFSAWHEKHHGKPVAVDWRNIGGTTDIVRTLSNQYRLLAEAGREDEGCGFDMMFGGGDYEFDVNLKPGVKVTTLGDDGKPAERRVSMSQPVGRDELGEALLRAAYPTHTIDGKNKLYDADGHWWGVVLSSFGIVYNRDVLAMRGLGEPTTWSDLADPKYDRWVALADPSHSGSVKVTYNAIIQRYGYERGVATLRRVFANARYFADGASKVPIDVSQGEAAAGICIDFYGRYQSQAVGGGRRVGFVAPAGATLVSSDPIAVLRGAKNRETAVRFIQFLLSKEGQAVWNFRVGDEMGPRRFELRRSPIRRDMYALYTERMIDRVNPFEIAEPVAEGVPSYNSVIPTLLHAMCMDIHDELRAAWRAIYTCEDPALKAEMLAEFDRMPFTHAELFEAKQSWKNNDRKKQEDRMAWTAFFRAQYRKVVAMAR